MARVCGGLDAFSDETKIDELLNNVKLLKKEFDVARSELSERFSDT
jgi:hypothetical protein